MFYVYIINLKLVRQRIDGNIHYIYVQYQPHDDGLKSKNVRRIYVEYK